MPKKLPAFSFIEIAIVLMVMGILMMGALKGKDLIDAARLYRLAQDIQTYQIGVLRFYELFHALPGDFDKASTHIKSGLPNGNGNGVIEGDGLDASTEAYHAWTHLGGAGLIEVNKPPVLFGGGTITFRSNPRADLHGVWLQIGKSMGSQNTGGLLTPRQTQTLIEKIGPHNAIADNGTGTTGCLAGDGSLNIMMDKPLCILYIALNV